MSEDLKELQWGQTPMDALTHEERRALCERSARLLTVAQYVINDWRDRSPLEPFWAVGGRGYRVTEALDQVLALTSSDAKELEKQLWRHYMALGMVDCVVTLFIQCQGNASTSLARLLSDLTQLRGELVMDYDGETVHRSFFRTAQKLLFSGSARTIDWYICDTCGVMTEPSGKSKSQTLVGQACMDLSTRSCAGTMRDLRWADLGRPDLDADGS